MKRSCEACGRSYATKTKRSRYCSTAECRRERERRRKRGQNNVVPFPPTSTPEVVGSVCEAVKAELTAAGKLGSSVGQAAMSLARRLDDPNDDTGSSQAAVAKQLHALMAEALRGVKVKDDPLDELRAQRERRLRGA